MVCINPAALIPHVVSDSLCTGTISGHKRVLLPYPIILTCYSLFFLKYVDETVLPTEIKELKKLLPDYKVYNYVPPKGILENFKDGGVAIIDQWICAHARFVVKPLSWF